MLPSRTWSRQTGHRAEPNGLLGRTAWDSHSAMRLVGVPCPSRLTGPIWSRSCSARTRRTGRWDGLGPYLIPTAIIAHSKGGVNAESVRGVSAAAGGLSSGERQRGRRISVGKEWCDIVWETHIGLGAGEEMSPRPDCRADVQYRGTCRDAVERFGVRSPRLQPPSPPARRAQPVHILLPRT